jgi:hypothetical protein
VLLFVAALSALLAVGRMDLLSDGGRIATEIRWLGLVLACMARTYLAHFPHDRQARLAESAIPRRAELNRVSADSAVPQRRETE